MGARLEGLNVEIKISTTAVHKNLFSKSLRLTSILKSWLQLFPALVFMRCY